MHTGRVATPFTDRSTGGGTADQRLLSVIL